MPDAPPDGQDPTHAADRTKADVRVPRVVVTGSESTGKTTLAGQLALALATLWVPEFSREYAEQAQRELTAADVAPIARGQMRGEEEGMDAWRTRFASHEAPPPLILDTDLVSTTVYAEHYYGHCPAWIMEAAWERRGDLYLLCAPDLPWVADGVRDQAQMRASLDAAFRARLGEFGVAVEEVPGPGAQRLERALTAVGRWAGSE